MNTLDTIPETEKQDLQKDQNDTSKKKGPSFFEGVDSASKDAAVNKDALLKLGQESKDSPNELLAMPNKGDVVISDADKAAFLDSIVSGSRFESTTYLFGGRLKLKLRSRSLEETEAILSFLHRTGVKGELVTKADVSNAALTALLVAQVKELGDVSFDEMRRPLKYVETADGVKDPGWVKDLKIWNKKPEALCSAIGAALVDFEAKYWKMVDEAKNENFWNPGGSTGK